MANAHPEISSTIEPLRPSVSSGWGIKHGVTGGIIAGIAFAMFEMIAAAIMMGTEAFFMPLRMIGAIVLGPAALDPSYLLATAGLAGLVVHMVLSAIYGAGFGLIVTTLHNTSLNSTAAFLVMASVYGLALWLFNFFVIAPESFTWFTETNQVVQFLAHTFFFGTVLGIYLDRMARRYR